MLLLPVSLESCCASLLVGLHHFQVKNALTATSSSNQIHTLSYQICVVSIQITVLSNQIGVVSIQVNVLSNQKHAVSDQIDSFLYEIGT